MKLKNKVDKFIRHEALHLSYVLFETVSNHLLDSSYIKSGVNKKFNHHIKKATDHLWKAYQSCNEENEKQEKSNG